MLKTTSYLACFLFALVSCAPVAQADSLVTGIVNPDPFDFSDTGTIGYAFSTGSNPINVTSLGMWDENLDGFTSSVDVGLWDIVGNLLGLVTVPAGTGGTLVGEFRYTDLNSTVTLSANSDYVLGAYRLPGVAYNAGSFREGIDFTVDSNFDIIEDRASSFSGGEPTIEFPDFVFDPDEGLIGPNLQFNAIPEPTTAILLAVGFLGAVCRRKR